MAIPEKFEFILKGPNFNLDDVIKQIRLRSNSNRKWEHFTRVVIMPIKGCKKIDNLLVRNDNIVRSVNDGENPFSLSQVASLGFLEIARRS